MEITKNMRILFISSSDIIAGHLAYILKQEGNEVKLFIDDEDRKRNFDGMVDKVDDWRQEIDWVGKEGLIVFDDVGYGETQDELRSQGYSVFGGSAEADRLEFDRQYAQVVLRNAGLNVLDTLNFDSIASCREFLKSHAGPWVIKQNGHALKGINFVSSFEDNRDSLSVLDSYERIGGELEDITLQRKAVGVEIGVGRYFNGNDWVGPIEINIEHKRMFPGDLGPSTTEMGTIAWYDDNENNRLFRETLAKLKPVLAEIRYKGDFEINCIVNESGIYPLEITPRFGSPIVYVHFQIHQSPWGEFLKAIADGKSYDLKWRKGYGIVVLLAVPPFPYVKKLDTISLEGAGVFFDGVTDEDSGHIYYEGIARRPSGDLYLSDGQGYVLYSTALADDLEKSKEQAYRIIEKIRVPKSFYRNDIGDKFIEIDCHVLRKLGYID